MVRVIPGRCMTFPKKRRKSWLLVDTPSGWNLPKQEPPLNPVSLLVDAGEPLP